jgi:AcrR family transcriptional regulator
LSATRHTAVEDRPLRADARRNRERILVAATRAFGALGSAAQMDDVARSARVGVGTVYRHFPTKEALMGELVRRRFASMQERAEAALLVEDPWEAFAGMLRGNAEVMAGDAALRDALSSVPEAWERAAEERRRLGAVAERVIRRGQEAGVVRADLSADDIPMLMCGISSAMSSTHDPAWDWRRHLELVLDGLRAR